MFSPAFVQLVDLENYLQLRLSPDEVTFNCLSSLLTERFWVATVQPWALRIAGSLSHLGRLLKQHPEVSST